MNYRWRFMFLIICFVVVNYLTGRSLSSTEIDKMKYRWRLMILFICFVAGNYLSVANELCDPGYFLSSGKCNSCPNTCETCWASNHCDLCKLGYYGETCSFLCPIYCTDCSKNTGRCKTPCPVGSFVSKNQSCLQCPQHCTECNETYCSDCEIGFTGPTCQNECVNCRPGTGCHKDGFCLSDCKDSFSGKYCNKTCPSGCSSCERLDERQCITCVTGRYGQTCQSQCNEGCKENICGKSNESCLLGCKKGYSGTFCDSDSESSKPDTLLVGVIVGILLSVALIGTIVILIYRRRKYPRSHRHPTEETASLTPLNQEKKHASCLLAEIREETENPDICKEIQAEPISRHKLEELIASKTKENYQEEFKYILGHSKGLFKSTKLTDAPEGVLNASFIDNPRKRMAYIVCKAPTENTKEIFWNMVLKEKCTIIVLLSKGFTSQQRDDNTYYPKNNRQHVSGDVQIPSIHEMFFETHCSTDVDIQTSQQRDDNTYYPKNDRQHVSGDIQRPSIHEMFFETHYSTDVDIQTICFSSKVLKPDEDRSVVILHFTGWFEAEMEETTSARLANFLTQVRKRKTTFPQLVCSSGGVSLCGIYLALDMMVEELESTNQVNIVKCVSHLLQQRPDLIQTVDEYEFIHKALVSYHKNVPKSAPPDLQSVDQGTG